MAEIKMICEYPETLKRLIEEEVAQRLRSLEAGIHRTEERIKEFEDKYQMSTEEFLRRFENDDLQHRLDMEFDEWVGESRMLKMLREKVNKLKLIHNAPEVNIAELKIICEYQGSLKQFLEEVLSKRITSLEDGIRRTEERIKEFENKYQMSTEEFLSRYENDEIQETLEIDEWIGESWMLKRLQEDLDTFKGIEFVI